MASLRVVVVGGGQAGLQAARALHRAGFSVSVLEESNDVGQSTSFKGINQEVPWSAAQMPEFPLSRCHVRPSGPFPTPGEMQEYAKAYAHAFNLFGCIKLNCKLVNLAPDAQNRWVVSYTNTEERRHYQITASFVVLCTGIHTTPAIPIFPGNEDFRGRVVHSKDLKDVPDLEGKRVVLVGNGQSQSDLQAEVAVAQSAGSVLLLNRKAHWPLPMRMGPISTKRILASRWGTSLVPRTYYAASGFSKTLSAAGQPMKRMVWWALKRSLNKRFKVQKANVIMEELHKDLHWGGHQSKQNWETLTQQTKVHSITGRIRLMSPEGLVLDGGQEIACDVIVMCTGYTPNYKFIDPKVNLHLQSGNDGVYLYRHLIHPDVKNLAFVGSMVTSANYVLTAALQSEWLCRALLGCVKLPTAVDMAEDIAAQRAWRKSFMRGGGSAGLLMPYTQEYHDQLMEDMGESKYRKGFNLFAEWFEPYSAADYASLFDPHIKRSSFKVKVNHTVQEPSSAAGSAPDQGEQVTVQACRYQGQQEQEQQAMIEEQREELQSELQQQRQQPLEFQRQNEQQQDQQQQEGEQQQQQPRRRRQLPLSPLSTKRRQQVVHFQVVEERQDSHERRQSLSQPLTKRRSVMFAVDPEEGMEEISPREASRQRLSRSALDELEARSEGNNKARTLHTVSRNSATSCVTREVGSGAFDSLFDDYLEGPSHSPHGGSDGGLLDSKTGHRHASTGHIHNAGGSSGQSSMHGRFVLGQQHSGVPEGGSEMSDLPSGRPSPVGHPSTHGGSAYRADWFVRDSNDTGTRHTRASSNSKTIHFSDWSGLSTRHGSIRPSTGHPSTKATDLMHTSESSCKEVLSGSSNIGGQTQPIATSQSLKLSNMNSTRASGSRRTSGSIQTSVSQNDSDSKSMRPNSLGDGDASMHSGRKESGFYSPLRRPLRSSMPSISTPVVDEEDGREIPPPFASDGMARLGIHLMMSRKRSAPTAMPSLDTSAHDATADDHSMGGGGDIWPRASPGPATRAGSFGRPSYTGGRALQPSLSSGPAPGVLDRFQRHSSDAFAKSPAGGGLFGGLERGEDVSVRADVCRTGSTVAIEGRLDGRLQGGEDSEGDVSVTAWGSLHPYARSSGLASSSTRLHDVAGISGSHNSVHVVDALGLSAVHSGVHSGLAHVSDAPGLSAARDLEGSAAKAWGGQCGHQQDYQSNGLIAHMSNDGLLVAGPTSRGQLSDRGLEPYGQGHFEAATPTASAAGSRGMRKEGGGHESGRSEGEGSVCIVMDGDKEGIHEGGAQSLLPHENRESQGCGLAEVMRQQQQQQQQQQHGRHSEEGPGFFGMDLSRSLAGTHSEGRSENAPSSGHGLFSGSHAEGSNSSKILDKRSDTFYMLSSRSSPFGSSVHASFALVSSHPILQHPSPSFSQAPDPPRGPPPTQTVSPLQAYHPQSTQLPDATPLQSLSPFVPPHHQSSQSSHTSKTVQLHSKPSSSQSSHMQPHSVPTPQSSPLSAVQTQATSTSPHQISAPQGLQDSNPSSAPLEHDLPKVEGAPSANMNSASTSYTHVVSSHMGINRKMGECRAASLKRRATFNDFAVLELLSVPPPIISTSRARSLKLRPVEQDQEQMKASEDLPLETAGVPQPHREDQPVAGSSLPPRHRRIYSNPEGVEPWNASSPPHHAQHHKGTLLDSGSPGYLRRHRKALPDSASSGHVQHHREDASIEEMPTCVPSSSHVGASHSNGSASAFARASQMKAEGAETQLARSPFQDHVLQIGSTDGHDSGHSLVHSANIEETHDGQAPHIQSAETARAHSTEQAPLVSNLSTPREKLGLIVSGEAMSVTDAPCASGTSITRHGSISGRLSKRLSAMLPAFLQKPRPSQPCGNGGNSSQRHSRSHDLPKVEQSASSEGPLEMVDPPHSEPHLGDLRKNRRKSFAMGMLARSRDNMRVGTSSLGASQCHPLASFLNQSSEGLNSQAGKLRMLGNFRSSSPCLSSSGSVTPITTAAAAQHVFQGIINEGLGQLIQHHEAQQQEVHPRQQQVASRALRIKAARNRRSSLLAVSTRHTEGAAGEVQPRTLSVSNMLKGMQRKLRSNGGPAEHAG